MPSPDDDPPHVPLDVVLELRYKLLAAQSRRDHAMDLTEEEAEVLAVCFNVGSEMLEPPIALYDAIIGKLPSV